MTLGSKGSDRGIGRVVTLGAPRPGFIGESRADLIRISNDYVGGKMPRVSQLLH